ncbi:hypothetical protein PHMEG_00038321 [Phytophthora megakarya]|uniref:Reverse transcriptase domain-containing protein n=1 Tax=Phytophthora megakarya TaxID=4795 RepID=A0A225UHX7_9STRA|nr:hypothetical protein PHMEG_00038321 [Phytophthora megakarya]
MVDLLSGYYQFCMRDSDVPLTAFETADGAYEYLVLPMGLSNAPATFNAGIRRILSDLSDICQSYFDDIYVYTKSLAVEDHLAALDRVLTCLEKHQFYVKLSKCATMWGEREFVLIQRKWKSYKTGHCLERGANCSRSLAQRFMSRDFVTDSQPMQHLSSIF